MSVGGIDVVWRQESATWKGRRGGRVEEGYYGVNVGRRDTRK